VNRQQDRLSSLFPQSPAKEAAKKVREQKTSGSAEDYHPSLQALPVLVPSVIHQDSFAQKEISL
jgi:hypothetical protein